MMMAAVNAAIPESYLAGKFAGNGTNNTKRHILRRRVIFVQAVAANILRNRTHCTHLTAN